MPEREQGESQNRNYRHAASAHHDDLVEGRRGNDYSRMEHPEDQHGQSCRRAGAYQQKDHLLVIHRLQTMGSVNDKSRPSGQDSHRGREGQSGHTEYWDQEMTAKPVENEGDGKDD